MMHGIWFIYSVAKLELGQLQSCQQIQLTRGKAVYRHRHSDNKRHGTKSNPKAMSIAQLLL